MKTEERSYAKFRDLINVDAYTRDSVNVERLTTEYLNLLMNAVTINGLDYDLEQYVKYLLFTIGSVGYDKLTNKWAKVTGSGLNDLGNPTTLHFYFANGKTFKRKACYEEEENGAYLINALPLDFSFSELIRETCKFINKCNVALNQNIDACKTPYIVTCKNKDLELSLKHAIQEKETGQAALIVSEEIGEGLKAINITTNFLADKFLEVRDAERDRLFNKLGIMSANINKRERVQVGEVNATLGQCSDYIYLLIDTFNKQMETYGLPYNMKFNGSLEELYEGEEVEGGEEINDKLE